MIWRSPCRKGAVFLSRPDEDYGGGEFLLLEQRPRAQSRGEAIRMERGELLIFPNADRPTRGKRGTVRTNMKHGVSRVSWGERHVLGLIFHDAR
ncbi:MAG: 2OG-Fe(II) oxygenase [Pseudomonadota bacterium]